EGIWASVTGRPLRDEKGRVRGGVIVCHDITERKRGERRLTAQYAVTRGLAESATLLEAAPRLLQAVCARGGREMAALWIRGRAADVLRCVGLWHTPDLPVPRLVQSTQDLVCGRGVSLPGQVWADEKPVWLSDLDEGAGDSRAAVARAEGLH